MRWLTRGMSTPTVQMLATYAVAAAAFALTGPCRPYCLG